MTNKWLWKKVKPFLTIKGCFSGDINIVKKSCGTKLSLSGDPASPLCDEITEGKIIDTYRYHSSVIAIKLSVTQNTKFNLPCGTTQE